MYQSNNQSEDKKKRSRVCQRLCIRNFQLAEFSAGKIKNVLKRILQDKYQSAIQVGPSEINDRFLLVADGARNNFCIYVIVQVLPQITLHRKWFVEELKIITFSVKVKIKDALGIVHQQRRKMHDLLVKALFWFMDENNSFAMLVVLRSTSTTHHLQNICDIIINVSFCFAIIVFSALQDRY